MSSAALPAFATVAIAVAVGLWPRRAGDAGRRRVELALAGLGSVLLVAVKLDDGWRSGSFLSAALPIQVCDVSSIACVAALLGGYRLASAIALYFGLALSSLALVFPDLGGGPASLEYWLFWSRHGVILASAIYLLAVRRFAPTWRDYARWCAFAVVYVALVTTVNDALGTNYAFIADRTPEHTRAVDAFGPWPGRAVVMLALAWLQAAALTWLLSAWPARRRAIVDCGRKPIR
nr:TIGR02206 family membrane protein [Caldimonas sp.]